MRKLFIIILLSGISSLGVAQKKTTEQKSNVWQKVIGGEEYSNIKCEDLPYNINTYKDGFLITGYSMSVEKAFVTYISKEAKVLSWLFLGGDSVQVRGFETKPVADGFVYIGEKLTASYDKYTVFVKVDENGKKIWERSMVEIQKELDFRTCDIYNIAPFEGGFWLLLQDKYNSERRVIMKSDSEGNKISLTNIKLDSDREALGGFGQHLLLTNDGGCILWGYTNCWRGEEKKKDIRLIKISSSGVVEWSKIFGENEVEDMPMWVTVTENAYLIAASSGSGKVENKSYQIYKIDKSGNLSWEKKFAAGFAAKVLQLKNGSYLFAGLDENYDANLISLDVQGNILWEKSYKGAQGGVADFTLTDDSGAIIVSQCVLFGSVNTDILIIKTDEKGNTGPAPRRTLWKKK